MITIKNSPQKTLSRCIHGVAFVAITVLVPLASAWGASAASPSANHITLGLPTLEMKPRAPNIEDEVALGRQIFFDKRLSSDGTISCSSCHDPKQRFTDGKANAIGVSGRHGTRNAMSLLNVAYQTSLFWDGRAADLESQALNPLLNHLEHDLSDEHQLLRIVKGDSDYKKGFYKAFGAAPNDINVQQITKVIASYERTLFAGGSQFDLYYFGGDKKALTEPAIRGLELFRGRAHCSTCHTIGTHDALFTDGNFHASVTSLPEGVNRELSMLSQKVIALKNSADPKALDRAITSDTDIAALGRFTVTLNPADIGQFKTPSLRNVALTSPYMHDGSISSLEEVINTELYVRGAALNYPIVLSVTELQDLLAFLSALTSPDITP